MADDDSLWVMVRLRNLKWHYCTKTMAYELIEEVGVDEDTVVDMEPRNEGLIDLPGMVMTDRSYQTIKLDGFKLFIPTEDFEYFHGKLESSQLRRFRSGDEYHKLHGWNACAMFTGEQRDMIVTAMTQILPEVRETAEAESIEFSRRLSIINRDEVRVVSGKDRRFRGKN